MKNAADESQVKEAGRKERDEQKKRLDQVRAVLALPLGQDLLWRLMEPCDRISAHNSGSWTYFNEGERNAALKIKAEVIEADPEAFLKMILKNQKREEEQNG